MPVGLFIKHQHCILDLPAQKLFSADWLSTVSYSMQQSTSPKRATYQSELLKVGSHIVQGCLGGETANKHLLGSSDQLGVRVRRRFKVS